MGSLPRFRFGLRYLEPTCFSGLFDDPLLYLKMRPLGRGLLFDCGKLHHLAKRVIKSLDAVFVSHAHMDHFMGADALIRTLHVAPGCRQLFGPAGIIDRFEHKLRSYDWNLAEPWWGDWEVCEVDGRELRRSRFVGAEGFTRVDQGARPRSGALFANELVRVEAVTLDHKLPVLGFRIEERPGFRLDPERISAAGLKTGPWVAELNRRWRTGALSGALRVSRAEGGTLELPAAELFAGLTRKPRWSGIGYLTDLGGTGENFERVRATFSGLRLLVIECAFLAKEKEQARRSFHLCSSDLNRLLAELRPRYLLPLHLSKTYLEHSADLYRELILPEGTELLHCPDYLSRRPLRADEVGWQLAPL